MQLQSLLWKTGSKSSWRSSCWFFSSAPAASAYQRKHVNAKAILLLNLLIPIGLFTEFIVCSVFGIPVVNAIAPIILAFAIMGWIVAGVWATTANVKPSLEKPSVVKRMPDTAPPRRPPPPPVKHGESIYPEFPDNR